MNIRRKIVVPTGEIFVVDGDHGKIEFVSLGDYGQDINLNQGKVVPCGLPVMPLTEKWVVTVSTQYGCSMNCSFCDVPYVGRGRNATFKDLTGMISTALTQKGTPAYTKRLNVHFARMGEPSWNEEVLYCARWIFEKLYEKYNPHPVVSTMMPKKNRFLKPFIDKWMLIKNGFYCGNAGLQLSINSTDEGERHSMFGGNAHTLEGISEIMQGIKPVGRKITLNFAVADYTVDCEKLAHLFSPDNFIVKLTPMHKTHKAVCNKIETFGEYTSPEPYQELESRMQKSGFETLVFIASKDEDESLITCGNAVLSGSMPKCEHSEEIYKL